MLQIQDECKIVPVLKQHVLKMCGE